MRRNVYKAAVAYAVVAWLLIQLPRRSSRSSTSRTGRFASWCYRVALRSRRRIGCRAFRRHSRCRRTSAAQGGISSIRAEPRQRRQSRNRPNLRAPRSCMGARPCRTTPESTTRRTASDEAQPAREDRHTEPSRGARRLAARSTISHCSSRSSRRCAPMRGSSKP